MRVELVDFAVEVPDYFFVDFGQVLISLVEEGKGSFYDDLVLKEVLAKGHDSQVLWDLPVVLIKRTLVRRLEGVDVADEYALDELPLCHQQRQVEQVKNKGIRRVDVQHDHSLLEFLPEGRIPSMGLGS